MAEEEGRETTFFPTNSSKDHLNAEQIPQLLNTGGGHQAPRKAAHCLQKEVGQNIKDKKRDKRVRDGDLSWAGSLKREVSKHQATLSPGGLWGVLESQKEEKINK